MERLILAWEGHAPPTRGTRTVLTTPPADADTIAAPALEPMFLRPQRTGVRSAWYGHVPFAHWLVAAAAPRVLIELGTHNGVSYAAFCEAMARYCPHGRAYAIDTWQGDEHAGHYGDDVFQDLQRFHDERYASFSELLRCTFEAALPYFADASVDLLHIDGLHTYDAVRADWEAWRPKLSPRAVVLFHDTNVRERGFGVWRLWQELSAEFPHFEFLHEHGLGVLACGEQAPEAVLSLCALQDQRAIGAVRQRFTLLGERWQEAEARQGHVAAQQSAEADLAGARNEIAAARAEQDRLEGSVRDYQAALATADANGAEARAERDRLAGSETRLTTALADADAEVADLRIRVSDLEVELERLRQGSASATPEAAELQRLHHAHAAKDSELAALRAHHHAIVSSLAWRASAPARQFGQRFPAVAHHLTRAASLGSAAMTGRLPGRLRLRRQVRDDAETLVASPLFDRAGYLARYPDVAASGTDPLWHYIWAGAAAGYDPHPLFSSRWYLAQHPELAGRVNPLAHYLREGAAAGHDPHPLFDTAFYVEQEPDAEGRALQHFIETGAARASDPNPFFDVDGYWNEYVRGRDEAHDPLSHYVLRGAAAGHDPHPLFDTDWYAAAYPDSAGWNPLGHFLREGRARGYAPCLLVAQSAGMPPALHFRPEPSPTVSIVVPVYGRLFDTLRCLTSIMVHTGPEVSFEVIVADDRPDAPVAGRLREVPNLRVEQNPRNLGFLRSCNRAAELATGRYILFLNNDTTVHPNWLAPMVRLAEADARVGLVGAKLLNADGTVQEAGGIIHRNGWGFPYGRNDAADRPEYGFVREVDVVIGACMLVRAAAWEAVGGFDDRYAPAYYEEFDLAFALRDRGWRVMFQPASHVTHFDSASYGAAERDRQSTINHAQFCRKWADALRDQPRTDAPLYLARERPLPGHILVIDDRVPEPDKHAGAIATFDWLRLLRGMGFRVSFQPHDNRRTEPYTAALQQMGVEVLYGAIDMPAWIKQNGRHLDWIWLARPAVAEPLLEAVRAHAPGKLIYFTHDLHFLREQRRFELEGDNWHRDEARRLRRIERDIFRAARRVLTPSADELPVIRELAPGADARAIPLYTVPPAPPADLDAAQFEPRRAVLFVGGYDHPPNVDAARWLAEDIMPLVWQAAPDAVLLLAGSKPPPALLALANERVEVPGWVPDLAPFYARARLSLNALRYGAGVKGKIIASLQAGVPVVTTPVGNEGLGLPHNEAALVGGAAVELAAHAAALLNDAALCARLSAAGAALVRARFGEDVMRRALLAALDRELCPVCGRFAVAEQPVERCHACDAGPLERALACAAIAPFRAQGAANLHDAAPLLGRAHAPEGPLATALGPPPGGDAPLDLLLTAASPDPARVRPGGRIVAPAAAGDGALSTAGWDVRLHGGHPEVIEATRPRTAANGPA